MVAEILATIIIISLRLILYCHDVGTDFLFHSFWVCRRAGGGATMYVIHCES